MLTSRSVKVLLGIKNGSLGGGSTLNTVPSLVLPSIVRTHPEGENTAESLEREIERDTLVELGALLGGKRVGREDRQTLT